MRKKDLSLFLNRPTYWDRKGNPIDAFECAQKLGDDSYKVLEQTRLSSYLISTVWVGINFGPSYRPPLIFETMIFFEGKELQKDELDLDQWVERYRSEEAALEGHEKAVKMVKEKMKYGRK